MGLERFSVADHQPHAPGYILYIAAGRVFQAILRDPNSALVALSLLGGAGAVAGIYLVGRSIFDRATGLVAALLLLFSPIAWFYSEIALSYSLALLLMIIATWFIYQLVFNKRYPIASAVVVGIVAGFRPDVLIFMGPFWLYGTLRMGRKKMLLSWAVITVVVLGWLVPLMYTQGGIAEYRQITNDQYVSGVRPSSVFADGSVAFVTNAKRVLQAVFWMFGLASVALLFPAGLFLAPKKLKGERIKILFLLMMLMPAFVFFLFFLFDPLGYLLVYVAPLLLLAARGFSAFATWVRENMESAGKTAAGAENKTNAFRGWAFLSIPLILVAAFNSYLFIFGADIDWSLPTTGPLSRVFETYSAGGIRNADGDLRSTVDAIKKYNPRNVVLVTDIEPFSPFIADWRRLMYYLPEYNVIMVKADPWPGFMSGHEHTYSKSGKTVVPIPDNAVDMLLLENHPPEAVTTGITAVDSKGTGLVISMIPLPSGGGLSVGNYKFIR